MKQLTLLPYLSICLLLQLNSQNAFSDITGQTGLKFIGKNYGVAVGDYNKDGLEDLFAISHGQPCRLYRNNGNGTFTDVAPDLGLNYTGTPNAAGWFDANNDGNLDLLIANKDESNVFFLGNEDGSFANHTFLSGLLNGGKVRALLFADVNLDGMLDIYLARINAENILYLNMGNSQFVNFTNGSGTNDNQISMGAVFFDYDNDGDPDLYLTHDANQPNILYQNDGKGVFTDVSAGSGADIGTFGMGVDVADINHDGWLDIYVTNLYENSLLLNNGDGTFTEIGENAGVDDIGMGWGCTFLDVDNDGWQDIYAVNDSYFSPMPNVLYHNQGNLTFDIISENSPLASLEPGYGVVTTDIDNNGKMDLYLANYLGNEGNQLFRNDTQTSNNWVKLKLQGKVSNRNAIGTRVTIEAGGLYLVDELLGTSGYASQNGFTMHFGVGEADALDKLTIRWPNGLEEVFENLPINFIYEFVEGEGPISTPTAETRSEKKEIKIAPNPFVDEITVQINSVENDFSKIELVDLNGKQIKVLNIEKTIGQKEIKLSLRGFSAGVYFIRIVSDKAIISEKIIKK